MLNEIFQHIRWCADCYDSNAFHEKYLKGVGFLIPLTWLQDNNRSGTRLFLSLSLSSLTNSCRQLTRCGQRSKFIDFGGLLPGRHENTTNRKISNDHGEFCSEIVNSDIFHKELDQETSLLRLQLAGNASYALSCLERAKRITWAIVFSIIYT